MGLRPGSLALLRWALIAWVVALGLAGYLPKILSLPQMPLPFLTTLVQAAMLWACFNAVSKGSKGGRLFLTILASVQLVLGVASVVFYVRGPFALTMAIVGIGIRGAVISLVNEAEIRAIQPPLPAPVPALPADDHEWRPHGLLDGWIRCTNCGKIQAKPGEIALINRK